LLKDRPFLLDVTLWGVLVVILLYVAPA
jgi:hypothetical protein